MKNRILTEIFATWVPETLEFEAQANVIASPIKFCGPNDLQKHDEDADSWLDGLIILYEH